MPAEEPHFTAPHALRDIIIGMSDGLTVPFALAAGLTGAVTASHLVLTAGLAEIAAGSLSMGLGGYLAARSEADHYRSERRREEREVKEVPHKERQEVAEALAAYGLSEKETAPILDRFENDHSAWVDFMMRFELGLEEPDPRRALTSALTIAAAYIVGGIIPLAPYFFVSAAKAGLVPSIFITLVALLVFGYVKGKATGTKPVKGALETALIGGLAAGAAFFLASRF